MQVGSRGLCRRRDPRVELARSSTQVGTGWLRLWIGIWLHVRRATSVRDVPAARGRSAPLGWLEFVQVESIQRESACVERHSWLRVGKSPWPGEPYRGYATRFAPGLTECRPRSEYAVVDGSDR